MKSARRTTEQHLLLIAAGVIAVIVSGICSYWWGMQPVSMAFRFTGQTSDSCTDSDGGQNEQVRGEVDGLEAPDIMDHWTDYCGTSGDEEGKLVEYVCQSDGYGKKVLMSCQYGCLNGACSADGRNTEQPDLVIQNLQFVKQGNDMSTIEFDVVNIGRASVKDWFSMAIYIDGAIYSHTYYIEQKDGTQYGVHPDAVTPILPGGRHHVVLSNYYWLNTGNHSVKIMADAVNPGKPLNSWVQGILRDNMISESNEGNNSAGISITPSSTQESCKDSDGGVNYDVRGGVSRGGTPPLADSCYCPVGGSRDNLGACKQGPFLGEWFCNAKDYGEMKNYECPKGCSDGACIPSSGPPDNCRLDGADSQNIGNRNARDENDCRTIWAPFGNERPGSKVYFNGKWVFTFGGGVTSARCGDSRKEEREQCDDGNTKSNDGCSAQCILERGWYCNNDNGWWCTVNNGDGIIAKGGELCDDGNMLSGDGCYSGGFEQGWTCFGEPSVCKRFGGNAPCTDTDGGKTEFQKGFTRSGFGETTGAEDICAADGLSVYEAYCDGNIIASAQINCSYGCQNGACERTFTPPEGNDPVPPPSPSPSAPPAGYEDEIRVLESEEREKNWFSDLEPGSLVAKSANFLAQNGVIGGFSDGTFRDKKLVNRGEAAKFLMLARFKSIEDRMNNGRFRDIPENEWYVKFVMKAADAGIINGYDDKTFRPQNPVKTGEFLKMITLTFDLPQNLRHDYSDVSDGQWFASYAGLAARYHLFPERSNVFLEPDKELTRGDVAIAMYLILNRGN